MLGNLFGKKDEATDVKPEGVFQPSTAPIAPQQHVQSGQVVGSGMNPVKRQDLSALSHLDARTSQVIVQAKQETQRIQQSYIEPMQLLYALLFDNQIFELLGKFSVDVAKLTREIQAKGKMGAFVGQPALSEESKKIIEQAFSAVKNRGVDFIAPEDILVELFASADTSALLATQNITKEKLNEKLEKSPTFVTGKKSVLSQFGIDLTAQAKEGSLDPVVGREKEIERLVHIMLRRTKNNPIIIGEAGVGKTALIEGLAQDIVAGKAPKDLQGKQIIQLDLSSLVAGASHRGEFEERLRNVIKETQASSGKIILFIDEIHTLIGAGDTDGALDASNIIKPFLARGQLQIIGTTTTAEFRKHFQKDKAFERRFQPIIVEEPDEETAVKMLEVLKAKYEKFHGVVLTDEALLAAVKLSKKYIGERYLPDKAVDLLDEAAAEVRLLHSEGKKEDNQVKKPDIEKIVSSWTGIPITKLTEDESEKLLRMEDLIHERLIGQQPAVSVVSEAIRRGRIGLAAANRPIASFIFLGPTGVGKTELAKTVAQILFGKDDAMVRLDMSEYMEKHEVAKLIGAPPGYVGYEEGGQLTEAVRAKPYSIVLLDEVEKAHPDVFNILLQLLEDGRLTDNKGNTISFKNTIIIATSNIGSSLIQQQLSEEKPDADKEKAFAELTKMLDTELHKFFKPELLNRFDGVVVFEPLAREDMHKISKLGIEKTAKLLKEQGYTLTISDKANEQLAKEGYDPLYGARPLRRLIQTAIENPIALLLIKKTFVPGDAIVIDYDDAKKDFVFNKGVSQAKSADDSTPVDPSAPVQPDSSNAVPADVAASAVPESPVTPADPNLPVPQVSDAIAPDVTPGDMPGDEPHANGIAQMPPAAEPIIAEQADGIPASPIPSVPQPITDNGAQPQIA